MSNFSQLDSLLRNQVHEAPGQYTELYAYARCMAEIENAVVVVSDLKAETSKIYCGRFADRLGIGGYNEENSIWENKILSLMSDKERENKILSELRFFHFIRNHPKTRRNYYLLSNLRFNNENTGYIDVLHRMYYVYDPGSEAVRYAVCVYGPSTGDIRAKSIVVDSLTGQWEELKSSDDLNILSSRERQILRLIATGMKSNDIAEHLNISKHTVSRHRQEILAKLQVKNSIDACRRATALELI